jgi:hypothetical protein
VFEENVQVLEQSDLLASALSTGGISVAGFTDDVGRGKARRPGEGPQIQLWTERHNGSVRLWVKDNGIGINPNYHARLSGCSSARMIRRSISLY